MLKSCTPGARLLLVVCLVFVVGMTRHGRVLLGREGLCHIQLDTQDADHLRLSGICKLKSEGVRRGENASVRVPGECMGVHV